MSKTKKNVDEELIRSLAELLKDTELSEIELEQDGWRIRIARHLQGEHVVTTAAPVAAVAASKPAAGDRDAADHPGTVKSPMVGTAYLAASPDSSPFVEIGTQVTEGQTVLIVEAMKTMNHIPAPRSGTVTAILVENGHPVEFGEPLMILE
jgi:acetyl-CoA carboxylase biotin carboxyl carrier protein